MGKKERTLTDRRPKKPSSTLPSKKFGAGDKKYVGGKSGGDNKFGDKKLGDKKFGDKKFGDNKLGDDKKKKKIGPRGLKKQMRAAAAAAALDAKKQSKKK